MNKYIPNPETDNLLLFTLDSYKDGHHHMYEDDTEVVVSYFESRIGAMYDYTVFFSLQKDIIKWLLKPVTQEMVDFAAEFAKVHFFDNPNIFNKEGWDYIVNELNGKLPIRIRAVPEGTRVPINNVMMVIENTDPKCWWLTNALETLLTHVWYGSVVATRSTQVVDMLKDIFEETSDVVDMHVFYVHDFGQRGAACMEQAGIGGLAHLISSRGTDTKMAIPYGMYYYDADMSTLGYSVAATEHSIMTSKGREEEFTVTRNIIRKYPNGILSVVSDSYDIENAINMYCTDLKEAILGRNGKFVVRPDSPRWKGDTVEDQVLWIVQELEKGFGTTVNSKGYKVLNPKVGVIYGDGISPEDIRKCLQKLKENGYSAENCVYGMGGGLLQKLNRDTQRSTFKCCAQRRNGVWYDISKDPSDATKASKKGRLKLIKDSDGYKTVLESDLGEDLLVTVYENGELLVKYTFDQVRQNASVRV